MIIEEKDRITEKDHLQLDVTKMYDDGGKWYVEGYGALYGPDRSWPLVILTEESLKGSEDDLSRNSTVFLEHRHDESIGKIVSSKLDSKGLWVKILISKTRSDIWQMVREEVLNSFSVGFMVNDYYEDEEPESGEMAIYVTDASVFEMSLVGLPANEGAKVIAYYIGKSIDIGNMNKKKALKYVPNNVSTETAPEDTEWEAPDYEDFGYEDSFADLDDSDKRNIAGHFAFSVNNPPETYGDLKLPHHRVSDGKVVWNAVSNAAARLNQTEDIPEDDMDKVKSHLAAHYEQFDRVAPWIEEEDKSKKEEVEEVKKEDKKVEDVEETEDKEEENIEEKKSKDTDEKEETESKSEEDVEEDETKSKTEEDEDVDDDEESESKSEEKEMDIEDKDSEDDEEVSEPKSEEDVEEEDETKDEDAEEKSKDEDVDNKEVDTKSEEKELETEDEEVDEQDEEKSLKLEKYLEGSIELEVYTSVKDYFGLDEDESWIWIEGIFNSYVIVTVDTYEGVSGSYKFGYSADGGIDTDSEPEEVELETITVVASKSKEESELEKTINQVFSELKELNESMLKEKEVKSIVLKAFADVPNLEDFRKSMISISEKKNAEDRIKEMSARDRLDYKLKKKYLQGGE